jgi:carbon storage regulator
MLVLTRKLNQEITIGQQGITLKVLDVRGGRVRLGVSAPLNVRIERAECHSPRETEHAPCPSSRE